MPATYGIKQAYANDMLMRVLHAILIKTMETLKPI